MQLRNAGFALVYSFLLVGLGACDLTEQPHLELEQRSSDLDLSNPMATFDEKLLKVAQSVPSFGGMYRTSTGKLAIVVANRENAVMPTVSTLETAVATVFDLTILEGDSELVEGKYSFTQLYDWMDLLNDMLSHTGVTLLDIDEVKNRITVGYDSADGLSFIQDFIDKNGIPVGAVTLEKIPLATPNKNLNDNFRPVVGGVKLATDKYPSGCTLGLGVAVGSSSSTTFRFLMNSHCTDKQGGVESTAFYQANVGSRIGTETSDPRLFSGGACPAGRVCRYSDAALAAWSSGVANLRSRGLIANVTSYATGATAGSLTISTSRPSYAVGMVNTAPLVGDSASKVGRRTGGTRGTVRRTCVRVPVSALVTANLTLLCQYTASYYSDGGDSGSPVFSASDYAMIQGLHWGSNWDQGGNESFFSSIDMIERELGPLDFFYRGPL